jgi:serine/threonine-protein kinase
VATAVHPQLRGRLIAGKFLVEALIGEGGMGAVWRARQTALDRAVALKILHPEFSAEAESVERFRREAMAASRLEHPSSVRIFDFGKDGELLYLAMEHVEGRTLLALMEEEWPLPSPRIVDLLSQVLSAVAVAHDLGIIHRDLKPDNILVATGPGEDGVLVERAKVCDFGIAELTAPRMAARDALVDPGRMTDDGTVMGTPEYFSPEQARGEPLDGRSDLYALGVVLYHLLARRPPFQAESALAVSYMQTAIPPEPPSRFAQVSPALEAVCLKAMNKEPEHRYQTAREMRGALLAATSATRTLRTVRVVERRRLEIFSRRRLTRALTTVAIAALLAAASQLSVRLGADRSIAASRPGGGPIGGPPAPEPPPPLATRPSTDGGALPLLVPAPAASAAGHARAGVAPTASAPRSAHGRRARRPLSLDEDGVLPPSFLHSAPAHPVSLRH